MRIDFSLPDLDGQSVEASDFEGRVLLVDVWATWCAPCLESFPFYAELAERYRPQGFAIVAVSVDEEIEDVREFLASHPVPFKIVHDPAGVLATRLGVSEMPSAALVGRDGRLLHVHHGFEPADRAGLETRIKEALVE